jgi:acetyl esterase/lipase
VGRVRKILVRTLGVVALIAVQGCAAIDFSPWPSALLYRVFMDREGEEMNLALERHVPRGITALIDQRYDANDADAVLDIYYPSQPGEALPAIVWIHGGGFFSGNKGQVANYLKILAARGHTAVSVGYSLGPSSNYPTPVLQVNAALAYLMQNAGQLRIDPERIFLAGDSAGAQIAAQVANTISVPAYATVLGIVPSISRAQLRGVILYCGIYDLALPGLRGPYGHFMNTATWAYSGRRDGLQGEHLSQFSVARFVTAEFPPAFISAGNGDPLLPHSRALAEALGRQGVQVDALFFPEDHKPAVPHEYQFNLDTDAGREALERAIIFVAGRDQGPIAKR